MDWNWHDDDVLRKIGYIPNKEKLKQKTVAEAMVMALPENYSIGKFAEDVALILNEEYGQHNFEKFLKVLRSEIKLEKKGRSAFTARD